MHFAGTQTASVAVQAAQTGRTNEEQDADSCLPANSLLLLLQNPCSSVEKGWFSTVKGPPEMGFIHIKQ